MAVFQYFGFRYEILIDKSNEVALIDARLGTGKVIIPRQVEYNAKTYLVTRFGSQKRWVEHSEKITETDKRKKNYGKFHYEFVRDYPVYVGPLNDFVCYEEEWDKIHIPNTSVKTVVLPDSVDYLGEGAFRRCYALEDVNLPKGITEIPERAFSGCRALKQIALHEGITSIGADAFVGCNTLKEITIPSSVKFIHEQAFQDATESPCGLEVVNIMNEEGNILIHPQAFTDRVKINYLGKDGIKPQAKEAKAEPASSPTIDLEKLIEAALMDGIVTDKERAILCKKVKSAGGDVDEFELLLDARIYEAQQNSKKAESTVAEPKSEPIQEVIKSKKDSKPDVAPAASSATGEILWVENIWAPLREKLAKMSDIKGSKPSDKNYTTYKIKSIDAQLIVWYTEKTNEAGVALETLGGETVKTVVEDVIAKSPAGSAVREAKLSQGKKNKDKWSWVIVTNIDVNDSNLVQWYADNILAFYSLIENK